MRTSTALSQIRLQNGLGSARPPPRSPDPGTAPSSLPAHRPPLGHMHVLALGHSTPTQRRHSLGRPRGTLSRHRDHTLPLRAAPRAPSIRSPRVWAARSIPARPSHIDQQTCIFKSDHPKPSPGQKRPTESKAAAEETPVAPGSPSPAAPSLSGASSSFPVDSSSLQTRSTKPSPCAPPALGVYGANSVGVARPEGHPAWVTQQAPSWEDFLTQDGLSACGDAFCQPLKQIATVTGQGNPDTRSSLYTRFFPVGCRDAVSQGKSVRSEGGMSEAEGVSVLLL